jgi:Na+/melibiose symporter-like transporter
MTQSASLSRTTLATYALPALPLAALTLPLYIIVPTFYTETLGLPLAAVGLALLVVRVFDAVNDPLIGWFGDWWRPAYGRRRTLFMLAVPAAALSAFMLFWPPVDATPLWLAGWGLLLSLGYTGMLIPYAAWGAELAGDYRERSRVAGWREGTTLAGTLIAIALPFALGFGDGTGVHGLAVLGMVVAMTLVAFSGFAVWSLPEPREYSVQRLKLRDGLAAMRVNRPFLRLIAAFFVNGFANGIPATLFLYFVSDRLGTPELRGPLLFVYFLFAVAGVPIAVKLADRFSKHRVWCVAMVVACAVFALVPLIGQGDVIAFATVCVVTGLLLGFDLALPSSIQADVIDVDTAQSGEQRSAAYFAAWSLATKLSLALGVGLVFPALKLFGFEPGAVNDATALGGLVMLYCIVPIGFKLIAIALMWNFPLDRDAQMHLRNQIEARSDVSI